MQYQHQINLYVPQREQPKQIQHPISFQHQLILLIQLIYYLDINLATVHNGMNHS